MPESLRKIGRFLGLTDEEYGYEPVPEEPVAPIRRPRTENVTPLHERRAVAPVPAIAEEPAPEPVRAVVQVTPQAFNDAKDIGENLRSGNPVIMILSDCDEPLARRLVDYASGVVHGIDGKMERLAPGIFLIAPHTVDISDARGRVTPSGFFNQS